jgi:CheY-like chemotaxis protein
MTPAPVFLILLIDDDPNLIDILTPASHSVFPQAHFVQVHNTLKAKEYLRELDGYGPKLVLLDINLREKVNGLDFLAILRADSQTRTLPVIVLTHSKLTSDVQNVYAYGGSSFTNKPDSFEGWVTYLQNLRSYWVDTVTLPSIRFHKQTQEY